VKPWKRSCTVWERFEFSTTESVGASLVNSVSKFEQSMAEVCRWPTFAVQLEPFSCKSQGKREHTYDAWLEGRLDLLCQQQLPVDVFGKERMALDLLCAIDAQPLARISGEKAP